MSHTHEPALPQLPAPSGELARYHAIRRIEHVSDRVIPIGPWGVGADAVIGVVPGLGNVYTLGAGGLILAQAMRAGVSAVTLLSMIGVLLLDAILTLIPVAGDVGDALFRGHAIAGRMARNDIAHTHGFASADALDEAEGLGATQDNNTQMRWIKAIAVVAAGALLLHTCS